MTEDVKEQLANLRLRTQSDVHRMWELLMRPLGFSSTSLWVTFVDDRGAPLPALMEIGESEEVPTEAEVAKLFAVLTHVVADAHDIAGVAFLITRPGRGALLPSDRVLAERLVTGARRVRLPCEPVHVANDVAVLTIAPDDLAA